MKSFNHVSLAGMVCRDPELKYSGSGTAFCSWSMATSRKRGDKETTTWWRVNAFGKTAELAAEYLRKGRNVHVNGEAELEEYTDKEGQKRFTLNLNVSGLHFLDSKAEGAEPSQQSLPAPEPNPDDIPF